MWDQYTKSNINKLEMVQRRSARHVLNRYRSTSSVGEMLEQLEWETLEVRRKFARLSMLYKMVKSLVAVNMDKYAPTKHQGNMQSC